jgi:hypothetical protein
MLDPPEPFSTGMEPYMEPAMASARQPFVPSAPAGPWGGSERQWHVVPLWCPMRNGCNINVLTLSWGKPACYLTIIQIYSIMSNILLYHWIYTRFFVLSPAPELVVAALEAAAGQCRTILLFHLFGCSISISPPNVCVFVGSFLCQNVSSWQRWDAHPNRWVKPFTVRVRLF